MLSPLNPPCLLLDARSSVDLLKLRAPLAVLFYTLYRKGSLSPESTVRRAHPQAGLAGNHRPFKLLAGTIS